MDVSTNHNDLLYKYEILRAKLEIRDHYFNAIVREIYENTGQALSLVRIQLAVVGTKIPVDAKEDISKSGFLIGQAIFDLREMSKNFFPEHEILSESGLVNALKRELGISLHENSDHQIKVDGIPFALSSGDGTVFFFVVLELVTHIVSVYGVQSVALHIIYSNTKLNLIISYSGHPLDLSDWRNVTTFSTEAALNVKDRITMIGGELICKSDIGTRATIDISIPYEKHRAA